MALYAFDGTWNDSREPDELRDAKKDTNVHRFRVLYRDQVHYLDGVGSRFGIIGKIVGGLTGAGAEERIVEQLNRLQANFKSGDTVIDAIGYSRGAAIARMFVNRIETQYDLISLNNAPLTKPPRVRFLGLFDTVASFGIPWTASEADFRADIPEFVEHTFHAMALDETRETFGIERCLGNRKQITEVWFRGSHGDIGGNATYVNKSGESSNRQRSDIALNWMLAKAHACGLPVPDHIEPSELFDSESEAPVTLRKDPISIGKVGTLSRRIHLGDLVHHSVEISELTRGIDGRLLRRIDVPTRIEDKALQRSHESLHWVPPAEDNVVADNVVRSPVDPLKINPSIVELSSRRYPFDTLLARTWRSWLELWSLDDQIVEPGSLNDFWAPREADRGLAWGIYVELVTRITTQELGDDEGNDASALDSVYQLFPLSRQYMHQHGVRCANTATLINAFLNQKIRPFTAKWHKRSLDEKWAENTNEPRPDFRTDIKKTIQPTLRQLAAALSHLADARL